MCWLKLQRHNLCRNIFILPSTETVVQETSGTHRVPHDDVDIWAEGVVDVLGYVEVNKVTEVVVHVHPYLKNTQLSFLINMSQSMILHTVKMNCRNIFIQCLDSTNWTHTNVEKEHLYCVLLRWNKNKGFSYLLKLTNVDLGYIPASSFMKTVGFSTVMSHCPSSIGWKSSSVYDCSSAYLQK